MPSLQTSPLLPIASVAPMAAAGTASTATPPARRGADQPAPFADALKQQRESRAQAEPQAPAADGGPAADASTAQRGPAGPGRPAQNAGAGSTGEPAAESDHTGAGRAGTGRQTQPGQPTGEGLDAARPTGRATLLRHTLAAHAKPDATHRGPARSLAAGRDEGSTTAAPDGLLPLEPATDDAATASTADPASAANAAWAGTLAPAGPGARFNGLGLPGGDPAAEAALTGVAATAVPARRGRGLGAEPAEAATPGSDANGAAAQASALNGLVGGATIGTPALGLAEPAAAGQAGRGGLRTGGRSSANPDAGTLAMPRAAIDPAPGAGPVAALAGDLGTAPGVFAAAIAAASTGPNAPANVLANAPGSPWAGALANTAQAAGAAAPQAEPLSADAVTGLSGGGRRAAGAAERGRGAQAGATDDLASPRRPTSGSGEPALAVPAGADGLRAANGEARPVARLGVPAEAAAAALASQGGAAPTGPGTGNVQGAPALQGRVDVPVGQPGFGPALGAQVSLMLREGVHEARLQLHPAEMGPITVQIALNGGAARVDFQAEVAATREAIEASLPALAGALQDAGFTLSGGGVFQQPGQGSQPRSDGGQPGDDRGQAGLAAAAARRGAEADGQSEPGSTGTRLGARRGLLDLVA